VSCARFRAIRSGHRAAATRYTHCTRWHARRNNGRHNAGPQRQHFASLVHAHGHADVDAALPGPLLIRLLDIGQGPARRARGSETHHVLEHRAGRGHGNADMRSRGSSNWRSPPVRRVSTQRFAGKMSHSEIRRFAEREQHDSAIPRTHHPLPTWPRKCSARPENPRHLQSAATGGTTTTLLVVRKVALRPTPLEAR
jgi:hypothetical protein